MDLPSKVVWDALESNGVTKLHHANSVLTSCQFLRKKALLSRGTVQSLGRKQTGQYSDKLDREYSLWFDVFADSVDIHDRAGRANNYGPVLFVLDLAKLRKTYTGRVWVTKLNPTKWPGTAVEQRWFRSKKELERDFSFGTFDQMIVFRHCGGMLPIDKCLEEIILDDPSRTINGFDASSLAYGALTLAMSDSGIDVPIKKRKCNGSCACEKNYRTNKERTNKMFYAFG